VRRAPDNYTLRKEPPNTLTPGDEHAAGQREDELERGAASPTFQPACGLALPAKRPERAGGSECGGDEQL
jgi:hypothetical protein